MFTSRELNQVQFHLHSILISLLDPLKILVTGKSSRLLKEVGGGSFCPQVVSRTGFNRQMTNQAASCTTMLARFSQHGRPNRKKKCFYIVCLRRVSHRNLTPGAVSVT